MIGTVLRVRYELTQLVSDGPVFSLYVAQDRNLGREVSVRLVKSPFASEQQFVTRLREVVGRMMGVNHPSVEKLLEVDAEGGTPFIVGEGSRGALLSERIRKLAPYSVPVSVSMAASILDGLEALHKAGLVHGDLSGQNVLIQSDGAARLQLSGIWETYSASETAGAVVLPSMAPYLAPEISNGAMPSPASDVYAVGVLLYQLLTGRYPYSGDTPVSIALKHATMPTPSARAINPSVPAALDEVVKRAMSKDPANRYQSASQMLSDLLIIEDAVRFGRPLTWPLTPGKTAAGPVQVAPKMSAVRPERPEGKPEREPADVPMWMIISLTSVLAVAAALVILWLGFNLSTPRLVTVPELRGLTSAQARTHLRGLKLDMRIADRRTSERYPADVVLDVSPQPGRKVREGSSVGVRLSSGSKFVEVPDLRGRSVDEARSLLSSLNLQLNERVDEIRSFGVEKGLIVRQIPEPRSKVERMSRIRVTLSSGRSAPVVAASTPDSYIYTVRLTLSRIEEPVSLRVDITDVQGTRRIYESRHLPDEVVEIKAKGYGREALFRIFYDGVFVKEVTKRAEEETSQPDVPDPDEGTTTTGGGEPPATTGGDEPPRGQENSRGGDE